MKNRVSPHHKSLSGFWRMLLFLVLTSLGTILNVIGAQAGGQYILIAIGCGLVVFGILIVYGPKPDK